MQFRRITHNQDDSEGSLRKNDVIIMIENEFAERLSARPLTMEFLKTQYETFAIKHGDYRWLAEFGVDPNTSLPILIVENRNFEDLQEAPSLNADIFRSEVNND